MIVIRTMCPADIAAVAEIEERAFSQPWSRQGFLDALQLEGTIFLVAEENERILGYIGMYSAFEEGEITNVAVDASARCRGIGGMLISEAKNKARQRGLSRIVLEVRVSNESAIRLYEKNGFVNRGLRKGFYDFPKEDAYIMIYGQ